VEKDLDRNGNKGIIETLAELIQPAKKKEHV
jgi:hypothetical protein